VIYMPLIYRDAIVGYTLSVSVLDGRVPVAKTLVDVDEEALAGAARALGTTTKRDTINAALREVGLRDIRARMLDRFENDPNYWAEEQASRDRAWRRDQP
jgi:Arc/MetJ family transcription regulator